MILHLVAKAEWDEAAKDKPYTPKEFDKDGFIHCTHGDLELLAVANRFFKSAPGDFVVIHIDEAKVTAPVKWEAPVHPENRSQSTESRSQLQAPNPRASDFDDSHIAQHVGKLPVPIRQPPAPNTQDSAPSAHDSTLRTQHSGLSTQHSALFPHIYGPLNRSAITGMRRMLRDKDGNFTGYAPIDETAPYDPDNPLNLKKPSELAQELLDATDGVSDAMKRLKERIEGRMSEIDEKIKKL